MPQLATILLALAALAIACTMDSAPSGIGRTPKAPGPTIRFDLSAKPLPEIPFPNDVATWPDPTSRTGLRVNASLVAPTSIERGAREKFSELEGWGTYAPITVSFDKMADLPQGSTAIDIANIRARHQGDDYDFADDAIYLVNLRTGIPVPIDLGEGAFDYTLRDLHKYWRNDHRVTEQTLIFETVDEARLAGKAPGTPYSPELDTDFDGVLDRPNLDDPDACPTSKEVEGDPERQLQRQQCIADRLLTFYERETDTIIIRPIIPLDEMTEYAVIITNRLVDPKGRPARSPFDFVYHPRQERSVLRLHEILNDADSPYFGDISGSGLDNIAFAWAFTTQPTVSDLVSLRDGLYGQGPFAHIADAFPPTLELFRAVGPYPTLDLDGDSDEPPREQWGEAPGCAKKGDNLFIMKIEEMEVLLEQIVEQVFDMKGAQKDALLASWVDNIDYVAMGRFQSPFFVEGGPKGTDPHASFRLDYQTGEGEMTADEVQFWMLVPKERPGMKQPFPVSVYGHGYTAFSLNVFNNAGVLARMGIASVGINAVGHGLALDPQTDMLAKMLFKGACLAPAGEALTRGRARDLNNDGIPDSGGDFWTSYVFHTRDVVRQSVIDWMQFTRIIRSFDGKRMSHQDYDGDGQPNILGDFDGDGVPDIGGPDVPIGTWGQSLGAFISGVHGAIDHNIDASAPVAGGVMSDVGLRSFQGGVVEAVILRMLGPLVVSVPASEFYQDGRLKKAGSTSCAEHQLSLRFVVPDVNDAAEIEFGCAESSDLPPHGATVIVHNLETGERRCARAGDEGRVRIGIPTSLGDGLRIDVYREADYVDSYGPCNPKSDRAPDRVISHWGKGFIAEGASHPVHEDETVCDDSPSCTHFQGRYYAEGSRLQAPADGYGFTRQSPDLRRFLGLAQTVLDSADAVTFMPYYALKSLPDPWGQPMKRRGLLDVQTIGDMNVPISAGIAYGRAAGALPFLTAEQGRKYKELVDYATPSALLAELPSGVTPNRLLIDQYVVEGINRLERHPVSYGDCARNMSVDTSNLACHPRGCVEDPGVCSRGQVCDEATDICIPAPPDPLVCARTLFDPDYVDEGKQLLGKAAPVAPLRLARIAGRASVQSFDQCANRSNCPSIWAPRLLGRPRTMSHEPSDEAAWSPTEPVVAMLNTMVEPTGSHTFDDINPCKAFDESHYLTNLVGHFFLTRGQDIYYLSHPASHHCMERLDCPDL